MKKIICLALTLFLIVMNLTGCVNEKVGFLSDPYTNIGIKNEIIDSLDRNDSQVQIALGEDFEQKKNLLQSQNLHAQGLMALCAYPSPLNIDGSDEVQKWFKHAFKRVELTSEQEVQIAKLNTWPFSWCLLNKSSLTSAGLIALCKNQGELDLNDKTNQELYIKHFKKTKLTPNQEVEIAKMGIFIYSKALLLKPDLSASGLIELCKNPGELQLANKNIRKYFIEAIKRTPLTEKEQVILAKINSYSAYSNGLLQRQDLTVNALITLSNYPPFSDKTQELFYEAIDRQGDNLTPEQKQLIITNISQNN